MGPESKHTFYSNLTDLAVAVAKEGCIETLSAIGASAEVELIDVILNSNVYVAKYAGVDGEILQWIRDEMETIAKDESNHSKLAWRALDWICNVDDAACRHVKSSVLSDDKMASAFRRRFGNSFNEKAGLR